jgi:hypothetical protein
MGQERKQMDPNSLWMRARNELLAAYDASGQPYYATTRPYKSTQVFTFTVVSPLPVGAVTMAYAKLLKGQRVLWFDYGVGDAMPWAPGTVNPTKIATDADTNLSRGRQTNGVEDFVIEAMSATHKATRVAYASGTTVSTDVDVQNMFIGNLATMDPAALFAPPQVQSPFNLEDSLLDAIRGNCSIQFLWDSKSVLPIGTLDEIPEGGAKSFLRASGDPRTDNRYKVPEGYTWRKQGIKDCDFVVIGEIEDTVIVPISLVATDGGATIEVPQSIFVDLTFRLHGIAIDGVGRNV